MFKSINVNLLSCLVCWKRQKNVRFLFFYSVAETGFHRKLIETTYENKKHYLVNNNYSIISHNNDKKKIFMEWKWSKVKCQQIHVYDKSKLAQKVNHKQFHNVLL